jgi:hypothetical protein
LRLVRKGFEKGRCHLCSKDEDAVHMLLNSLDTRKWMDHILSRKLRISNEKIAGKKIINYTNAV